MNLLSFFRPKPTASVARERLQIMFAHERALSGRPGLTTVLKDEILAVIAKHFPIDADKVSVKLDNAGGVSTLEIDIEMPEVEVPARAEKKPAA
jgi:cell division topological specificity factor